MTDRFTIAVFGKTDTVTTEIVSSWRDASCTLRGPYPLPVPAGQDWTFCAAIIDVRYEPDAMLPLMTELEKRAVPHIFFVPVCALGREQGPFVLSAGREDIRHIVAALQAQTRGATH